MATTRLEDGLAAPTIALLRLRNQHLIGRPLPTPADVIASLGAVQAQDYGGAKWAVAQRTPGASDAALDAAFDDGKFLRTHVLRPTWHFVTPADIRWLLELTAPRIRAASVAYERTLELDQKVFARTNALIAKALRRGQQLTRPEVAAMLARQGIAASSSRLGHIMMRAEIDGVVCSGVRRGKQMTYALLDDRAPQGSRLAREAALAELARRYFTSHGPATLQDFYWWSGLSAADARSALDSVKAGLASERMNDRTYFLPSSARPGASRVSNIRLLPNYDELMVAYKDRSPAVPKSLRKQVDPKHASLIGNCIVMNGQFIGTWRRAVEKRGVVIQTNVLVRLDQAQRAALDAAVEDYRRFLDPGGRPDQ